MSHSTVLVVLGPDIDPTDDRAVNDKLEDMLAPYDENTEMPEYDVPEGMEPIGQLVYHENTPAKFDPKPIKVVDDPNMTREERKEAYQKYRDECQAWGQRVFDELGGEEIARILSEDGEKYRWNGTEFIRKSAYNPQSKWDWWVLGGRWTGYFPTKEGASGSLGESGVFNNAPRESCVDVVRVGDIDWAAMHRNALDEREKYLAECDARGNTPWSVDTSDPDWRSKYLLQSAHLATYAWLDEQGWQAKGEMGWFGSSNDTVTDEEWNLRWTKAIQALPPKTVVAVVDVHI